MSGASKALACACGGVRFVLLGRTRTANRLRCARCGAVDLVKRGRPVIYCLGDGDGGVAGAETPEVPAGEGDVTLDEALERAEQADRRISRFLMDTSEELGLPSSVVAKVAAAVAFRIATVAEVVDLTDVPGKDDLTAGGS